MAKENFHTSLLAAAMDSAVDGIITIDEDAIIQSVNRSAENLFQYEKSEFLGRNVNFLMPEPWASAHDGYMWNYKKTGNKRIIGIGREVEGLRSDNTTFPIHLSVSEYEVDGKVFYAGIVHDLTGRKKVEEALFRSQKMEALGQLTGGIAHDFNNLLTIITGNLELLEMRVKDEAQLALLKESLEATELGATLITRLLAFAKRSSLNPEAINLSSVIETTNGLLDRTLGANISLEAVLTDELWQAQIDPGQLENAIINLAINARDAMPSGGKLVISTRNEVIDEAYAKSEPGLIPGEFVCLTVSDTGEGMSKNILRQVFEPFFTTKETGKGTGLGLSMIYGFAKQSGGHVSIYSEVGLGTTVNLYIPRTETESSGKTKPAVTSDKLAKGNGELILVVEDDDRVRKLSVQRIEQLNYKTITANSGDEALVILKENKNIYLVFTDLIMPGSVSGYDLAKIIHHDYKDIKVLMTSGYAEDLIHTDKLFSNDIKLLRKPYRQDDLANMLSQTLQS